MNKTEKASAIDEMAGMFQGAPHVILADFRGLSANQSVDLRRKIRKVGGNFRVLKNRLAKRAAAGTALEKVSAHLVGARGAATHPSDPIALAKVLSDFAKDHPQLVIVAAVVDAKEVLNIAGVKTLAMLPGLPVLQAQLLALMQTPATQLVRLLQTPASQMARALDARREKLEETGS